MAWLVLHGVTQQTTPPNSPESNGMAERLKRTLQDKARTIMVLVALPGYLWGEIVQATNLLRNMTPATNMECTPFEKWYGKKPHLTSSYVNLDARHFVISTKSKGMESSCQSATKVP